MATTTATNGTNGTDSLLIQSFKAARRVSTPIVAIETPDAAATIIMLRRAMPEKTPTLSWDCAKGLRGLNESGKHAANGLGLDPNASVNATETLLALEALPETAVVFFHNFHLQMGDTPVKQGLWNLRDLFKMDKRMVVLLGPAFSLPTELSGDVIVFSEELPTRAELGAIIDQQHKNAGLALPDEATKAAALDALVGLSHYTAEQVYAMALEKTGPNIPKCWERKIKAIEATPGMTVYKPWANDTTLAELKGLDNVVTFAQEAIDIDLFNVIVFLDEMDKTLSSGMSDYSGDGNVGKDQVERLLTYINDTKSPGWLLAGIAGSGKTQLAKAMGAASGKPVIMLDLGGLKAKHVGESEANIRAALKVITATAEGKVLFVGTANKTTMFSPEMNRRFPDQFFFDLPDAAARKAIWDVYIKKAKLTPAQAAIPAGFDTGWTGAEIQRACERAAKYSKTVVQAARFIIPQAESAKPVIAQMRASAAGKFLSASHEGKYRVPEETPASAVAKQRNIEMN
jgi:hypothetical protein